MTIKECIDIVDNIKPNQYTVADKVRWLSFHDMGIINDVLKTHEGYDGRYDLFDGYTEDKLSVTLIVPSPYDRLYPEYLKMKIDGENGETAKYNNSAALYNSYLMDYRKYYNKTHMPIDATRKGYRYEAPKKHTVGLTAAEYENLKRDLYYAISADVNDVISHDKLYNIVTSYAYNNIEMLKGKDGKTPVRGVDYFTEADINSLVQKVLAVKNTRLDKLENDAKKSKEAFEGHLGKENPHGVTAEQVGAYAKDAVYKKNEVYSKGETDGFLSGKVSYTDLSLVKEKRYLTDYDVTLPRTSEGDLASVASTALQFYETTDPVILHCAGDVLDFQVVVIKNVDTVRIIVNGEVLPFDAELSGADRNIFTLNPTRMESDVYIYGTNAIMAFNSMDVYKYRFAEPIIDIDTELNAESANPIANSAVAEALNGALEGVSENLKGYIKDTDYATDTKRGIVKGSLDYGVGVRGNTGTLYIEKASNAMIDAMVDDFRPIVPSNLKYAVEKVGNSIYVTKEEYDEVSEELGIIDSALKTLDSKVGKIDTALDDILAKQNELIGGEG